MYFPPPRFIFIEKNCPFFLFFYFSVFNIFPINLFLTPPTSNPTDFRQKRKTQISDKKKRDFRHNQYLIWRESIEITDKQTNRQKRNWNFFWPDCLTFNKHRILIFNPLKLSNLQLIWAINPKRLVGIRHLIIKPNIYWSKVFLALQESMLSMLNKYFSVKSNSVHLWVFKQGSFERIPCHKCIVWLTFWRTKGYPSFCKVPLKIGESVKGKLRGA